MFGYIRARWDTLPEHGAESYQAVYCGLCRTMGKRYGQFSRLFLNYDFTMLAMLLAEPGDALCVTCRACPRHPFRGWPSCETGGAWLDRAAGESVILAYWKLRDTVADENLFFGLGARLLSLPLKKAYRKAREDYPDFDAQVVKALGRLRQLENEGCASLDRTADCFAGLLRAAAPVTGECGRDRAMAELLYHLGRWVYLIDAVDDLPADRKAKRYNPVVARFGGWTEEDQAYLRQLVDHSLALAGAAMELLPPTACTPAVENIIYSGLPAVEELVFSGRWREEQRKHRRSANERSVQRTGS